MTGKKGKIILLFIALFFIMACIFGSRFYRMIFIPNIQIATNGGEEYIYISTGLDYDDVIKEINKYLINKESFEWVVEKKNYKSHIRPGRYLIKEGMSNNELVNMLRGGMQKPVQLVFSNIKTKEQLASRIAQQIEADSLEIITCLNNKDVLARYNLDATNVMCVFIPNTYEFFWNTSAEKFFKRMYKEYEKFWTRTRLKKAESIGLSQFEVSILASIVEEETVRKDEMPMVAGVYMNRLAKGMRLQADPTILFAWNDFSIKRVLRKHLEIHSPYNTYMYAGLPPGPICIPSIRALEEVLYYKKHQYLYFCAKEDFSGYHNFSKTLAQHNKYAQLYQKALNRKKVYK